MAVGLSAPEACFIPLGAFSALEEGKCWKKTHLSPAFIKRLPPIQQSRVSKEQHPGCHGAQPQPCGAQQELHSCTSPALLALLLPFSSLPPQQPCPASATGIFAPRTVFQRAAFGLEGDIWTHPSKGNGKGNSGKQGVQMNS